MPIRAVYKDRAPEACDRCGLKQKTLVFDGATSRLSCSGCVGRPAMRDEERRALKRQARAAVVA